MDKRLILGKVDYNHSGRNNCEAAFTWDLTDGNFSMSAEIWNPRHTDIYCGGQCVDEVAKFFPSKYDRMVAIWRRWHLNDMKAGTPEQEEALRTWKNQGNKFTYDKACEYLKSIGLYEVPITPKTYNDFVSRIPETTYKYGSAWLREEIPADIKAEIMAWPTGEVTPAQITVKPNVKTVRRVTKSEPLLRDIKQANETWFSRSNKRFFNDVSYRGYYGQKTGKAYLVRSTYAWTDMLGSPARLHWRINNLDQDTNKIGDLIDTEFPDIFAVKHWLRNN